MVTSKVISGFLDHIRLETLPEFAIENFYVYDDSLDFAERAVQYVARTGAYQKLEGKPPETWAIIIWSRGSITAPDQFQRRNRQVPLSTTKDLENLDMIIDERMGLIEVNFKVVTNNMEYAETIEEYLYVRNGESVVVEIDYGDELGKFMVGANTQSSTTFEAAPLESSGTVIAVGCNLSISYPIFLLSSPYKNITMIVNTFINGNQNNTLEAHTITP